jgi:hypothetical protein
MYIYIAWHLRVRLLHPPPPDRVPGDAAAEHNRLAPGVVGRGTNAWLGWGPRPSSVLALHAVADITDCASSPVKSNKEYSDNLRRKDDMPSLYNNSCWTAGSSRCL